MDYVWTRQAIADASESLVSHLSEESRTLVVPSCPEWTLQELAWHLGVVQHFWAVNVRERNVTGPLGTVDDEMASDLTTFASWCRAATAELLEALDHVGDSSPCWTWWGEPSTAGAVARHQVQEAAVHAWDAANALGVAKALAVSAAHDGVPEFLHVHRTGIVVPEGAGVTLYAVDADLSWHLGAEATATVAGDASQLVLFLNGRVPLEELEVTGDTDVVRATFSAVDLS
jgi:uncharacterized protein (TIGR03083 family)